MNSTAIRINAEERKDSVISEAAREFAAHGCAGNITAIALFMVALDNLVRAEWVTGVALEVDGGIGLGASAGVAR